MSISKVVSWTLYFVLWRNLEEGMHNRIADTQKELYRARFVQLHIYCLLGCQFDRAMLLLIQLPSNAHSSNSQRRFFYLSLWDSSGRIEFLGLGQVNQGSCMELGNELMDERLLFLCF